MDFTREANLLTMSDVRRAKEEAQGPIMPTHVRLSKETLQLIEDSYRGWLLNEAKKKDAGHERTLIGVYKEEGYTSWEDKQRKELEKVPYMKAGDKIYGLTITIDQKMKLGSFSIQAGEIA